MHENGPICDDDNTKSQYLQISNDKFNINCKSFNNNCCLLKDGTCIIVLNIIEKRNKEIILIGKKLKYVKNMYEIPCKSSQFSIKIMTLCNDISCWPITQFLCKAWKISSEYDSNIFAIFPLNHGL